MRKNVCFTLPPDALKMLEELAENETFGNRSLMVAKLILRAYGGENNGSKVRTLRLSEYTTNEK